VIGEWLRTNFEGDVARRLPDAAAAPAPPRAESYVIHDGCVPGGTEHEGEDPAAAVVRAARQGTGLDVEVVAPLGTRFQVRPVGEVPQAWDHETLNLFWLPVPGRAAALDFGMGEPLDLLDH
jgi:hypothetical protein